MKVYKYVSEASFKLILDGQRIGFSHPRDFNDFFDRPWISPEHFLHPAPDIPGIPDTERKRKAQNVADRWNAHPISSFTRTHDNALMWAHYADNHKGVCIEFDTALANIASMDLLIPIQFGSVIYVKRPYRPIPGTVTPDEFTNQLPRLGDDRFAIDNYERLQRLLLTKPIAWSYEEEIRVVGPSTEMMQWGGLNQTPDGKWSRYTKGDGTKGYGLLMQPGAITRVFLGLRYPVEQTHPLRALSYDYGFKIMHARETPISGFEIDFYDDPYHQPA